MFNDKIRGGRMSQSAPFCYGKF